MNRIQRQDGLIVAALVTVCLLAALPMLTYPMGRDQGMYANIARSILNGGLPFIDMWDIKPPAIYYLYALNISLFGGGSVALRALDLITTPFTIAALYWLGLRLTGKRQVGVFAGILFTVFYFTETFASLTQSDSVVTLPMTLAVLCAVKAGDHPPKSRAALVWSFGTGALCALTIWFKHYYAIFVVALALNHLMTRIFSSPPRAPSPKIREGVHQDPAKSLPHVMGKGFRDGEQSTFNANGLLLEIFAFATGGLIFGGIPLLYFMSNGIWDEMLIVARGTAQYNAQAAVSFSAFVEQMSNYIKWRFWHWGVLLALAALWMVMPGLSRKGWRVVLLWLAAGLLFVLVQAKGFDTHWIPMLPPLSLLGAAALDRLLERRWYPALHLVVIAALFAILLKDTWIRAFPYLTGQQSQAAYYDQYFQANDLKPAESLRVVRFLKRHTQPGETLFIWGFRPEVYYLSGLRPATRFQAHFPLVSDWYSTAWQQQNVDLLWAAMPPYVLVLQADYMPWVTGKNKDSHEMLVEYTELANWFNANYERDRMIGNFLIWRRTQ